MKIVVMGQGYVGLPLAIRATLAQHEVIGFEPDANRCASLLVGESYIEDISNHQLTYALANGYLPSKDEKDLKDFDVAIITVPTPLDKGTPDLSYVKSAATQIALYLQPGALVVLESTTHPGTTRNMVLPILETASELDAGHDFHLGFSPERIDPGNSTWHFQNTPKIVSGLTEACRVQTELFYTTVCDTVVSADSLEAAELAKVAENTYRQINIAYANELGRHAHTLGVDVHHVLDLCATKPFGYTKFVPGPGVGGHCIPVDPVYLTHHMRTEYGTPFRMVELAQEINDGQPGYVARRLQNGLNHRGQALNGATILALGQGYKPDTADMRESPAVEVVETLRQAGAHVTTVDPFYEEETETNLKRIPADISDYDAVVLLTDHTAFDLQRVETYSNYVLDTRGVMTAAPHIERL